ncbi:MAG: bifunctional pyr operon transcriptional regulator/uracil phosphoribosyltransferase PyrR [Flavobacteriaceae bacterium]|nr:bifunctional pyr operon transcriptional regulator/uracil phosphoribosyltransferase PyrR [Flavobacteriaceae bacterium]
MNKKTILNYKELDLTLRRLACELVENHQDFTDTVLIGIQPRGVYLLYKLVSIIQNDYNIENISTGELDITFFRDDFGRRDELLKANSTEINIEVEGKKVVFVDDVLYSGRSIRSALSAIQSFGRPSNIELLVLIDRRFSRELPIQPDYSGRKVDSIDTQRVEVEWNDEKQKNAVYLTKKVLK